MHTAGMLRRPAEYQRSWWWNITWGGKTMVCVRVLAWGPACAHNIFILFFKWKGNAACAHTASHGHVGQEIFSRLASTGISHRPHPRPRRRLPWQSRRVRRSCRRRRGAGRGVGLRRWFQVQVWPGPGPGGIRVRVNLKSSRWILNDLIFQRLYCNIYLFIWQWFFFRCFGSLNLRK